MCERPDEPDGSTAPTGTDDQRPGLCHVHGVQRPCPYCDDGGTEDLGREVDAREVRRFGITSPPAPRLPAPESLHAMAAALALCFEAAESATDGAAIAYSYKAAEPVARELYARLAPFRQWHP